MMSPFFYSMVRPQYLLLLLLLLFSFNTFSKDFVVDTINDLSDDDLSDGLCKTAGGHCALRAAIQQANALAGNDTVRLGPGIYTLTIGDGGDDDAKRGDLDIRDDITIVGGSSVDTIVDAQKLDRIFQTHGNIEARLSKITMRNGFASVGEGGSVKNGVGSRIQIDHCRIETSGTHLAGGAIFNEGSISIVDSEFVGNYVLNSSAEGGAIANERVGIMLIKRSYFSDNVAGGATTARYSSTAAGGAIYNRGQYFIAHDITLSNNAAGWGGGLYATGRIYVDQGVFDSNMATFGGGIYLAVNEESALQRIKAQNNSASGGGGIYVNPDSSTPIAIAIEGSVISNNSAGGTVGGGGVFIQHGIVSIAKSLVANNSGSRGGGVVNINGKATFENVTITNNTASKEAGGVVQDGTGTIEFKNVTIADNFANTSDKAGNLLVTSGNTYLLNSIVSGTTPNCVFGYAGTLTSQDNNVVSDTTCRLNSRFNDSVADPLLMPLSDNGGLMLSRAIADNSPARNKAQSAYCPSADQRYFRRSDSRCDAGAYEVGAIAAKAGTLEFVNAEVSTITEDSDTNLSQLIIPVRRVNGSEGAVTIRYSTTFGSAGVDDYSHNRGMLTWNDGDTSIKNIQLEIRPDERYEPTEDIAIELFYATGGAVLGSQLVTRVEILDNDFRPGRFRFERENSAFENAGEIKLAVIREDGFGNDGLVSVRFTTVDGSAHADEDFVAITGELNFAQGESKKEIVIPFIDDKVWEGNETFEVVLSDTKVINAPWGGDRLPDISTTNGTAIVTIREQDPKHSGVIDLSSSSYVVNEDAGGIEITLNRSGGSDGEVAVLVNTLSLGKAVQDQDFTRFSQSVIFAHLETQKTVSIAVINDPYYENDESFNVKLVTATNGAKLGTITQAAITIISDDPDTAPVEPAPLNSSVTNGDTPQPGDTPKTNSGVSNTSTTNQNRSGASSNSGSGSMSIWIVFALLAVRIGRFCRVANRSPS